MRTPRPEHWRILFGLWVVQGIAAFCWLILIPTDTEDPLAFGFSPARLILVGTALALTAVSISLWLQSKRSLFRQTWLNFDQNLAFWDLIYVVAVLAVTASIIFITAIPLFKGNPLFPIYAARLLPLVLWMGLSSVELTVLLAWNRYEKAKHVFTVLQPIGRKVFFLIVILSLLGGLIAITKIGITPDENFGAPPIPFLEWQVLLTLALIGVFLFFPNLIARENHNWIPLGIYLFTVVLWLSQPINTAFTATPPRAPNFEIYPFSDPQFYAQYAQSALTGNGFLWPEVPARPFYVGLLTWMHVLGNQSYEAIVVLQTLGLASFPVVLYLLGKELGGITLGLGLSLLAAFRDINSNMAVPFASNVTYSKLFLSELPTALFLSLATLLSIRMLRSSHRPIWFWFLIGGVFGAATLIRLQSSILIVLIIIFAFFLIPDRKQWLKGSIFLMIGFALTITPWLIRNYIAAGGLILDNPISQTMTMARRWSGSTGNEMLPRLPGENDAQYSSRLTKQAITSFMQHPGFILSTAANHLVNSEITSLLAFPIRDEIRSLSELWMPQHAFWKTPLLSRQVPLFLFYLLLFSIGVATVWHYHGLIGLLPLGFGLIYNAWTALFMSSGERFIVPLDWSVHLYELFGLIILAGLVLSFAQGARENIAAWFRKPFREHTIAEETPVLSRRRISLSLALVLLLGAFLPVTESMFPQKYPPKSQNEITQQIGVMAEQGEIAIYGRALYPRFYEAGDGEPETAKLGYGPDEKARLVFFLVGPKSQLIIFETESAPQFFPNTSDVYLIGTQMQNYFSPRVVKVTKDSRSELYINK